MIDEDHHQEDDPEVQVQTDIILVETVVHQETNTMDENVTIDVE